MCLEYENIYNIRRFIKAFGNSIQVLYIFVNGKNLQEHWLAKGDWEKGFVSKLEDQSFGNFRCKDRESSCLFHDDKIFQFKAGELFMLDLSKKFGNSLWWFGLESSNWKMERIGKTVFSSGSRSTLVAHDKNVYLFVGESMKTYKELKQSGFYKYNQGIGENIIHGLKNI